MSHHTFMALLGFQGMWVCLSMYKYRGTALLSPLPSITHWIFHSIKPLSPQFAPNLCTNKHKPLYKEPLQDEGLGFCLLPAPYSLLPPPKSCIQFPLYTTPKQPRAPPSLILPGTAETMTLQHIPGDGAHPTPSHVHHRPPQTTQCTPPCPQTPQPVGFAVSSLPSLTPLPASTTPNHLPQPKTPSLPSFQPSQPNLSLSHALIEKMKAFPS